MDVVTAAKVWMAVRPIRRIKEARQARLAAKRAAKELTSEGIEYEVTEDSGMALRTSTGAGLAGIAVNLLMQVLQAFPATAELATPEVAAGLTAVVMWVVARVWKTPEKPGAI